MTPPFVLQNGDRVCIAWSVATYVRRWSSWLLGAFGQLRVANPVERNWTRGVVHGQHYAKIKIKMFWVEGIGDTIRITEADQE